MPLCLSPTDLPPWSQSCFGEGQAKDAEIAYKPGLALMSQQQATFEPNLRTVIIVYKAMSSIIISESGRVHVSMNRE